MATNTLLDHCCIFTQGGLVLWSQTLSNAGSGADAAISASLDTVVRERLIQHSYQASVVGSTEDSDEMLSSYTSSAYSIKWTTDNINGLIFAVVYPRILTLTYIPTLLDTLKTVFISMFGPILQAFLQIATQGVLPSRLPQDMRSVLFDSNGRPNPISSLWKGWQTTFLSILRDIEGSQTRFASSKRPESAASTPSMSRNQSAVNSPMLADQQPTLDSEDAPIDAQAIAKNMHAFRARQMAKSAKQRKAGGDTSGSEATAGSDSDIPSSKANGRKVSASIKEMRRWDDVSKVSKEDMAALDFSPSATPTKPGNKQSSSNGQQSILVDSASLGTRGKDGLYSVADYKLANQDEKEKAAAPASSSLFGRLSASLGLSSKTMTKADLDPVLSAMHEQLVSKNVAKEVADAIIKSVSASLVGVNVRGVGSNALKAAVKQSVTETLKRILTPKNATDILLEIQRKRAKLTFGATQSSTRDPYAITFVGVNGVGKSTNLSKVAYWLLQNKLRVLIAACDTFRSGAVEQLRVHVKNLKLLESGHDLERIELYEKGYGKDAAGIAKEAIAYAKENGFDVVLIDTAGRMQDNEPLMRALAKLATVNKPDKIIFVGEALVGNEAVDQLVKFNTSLRNFTSMSGAPKGIDGIILTKFDTIDDKVGAAVSMTYVTGQPLLFVGTGQTYSDIRTLKVEHIVDALLA